VARITRKDLKTDKFALEIGHTVDFFEENRRDILRYGAAGLAVIALLVVFYVYRGRQHSVREQALSQALQVVEAPVAGPQAGGLSFPTAEAKDKEAVRVLSEVSTKYSGTNEGSVAEYLLAATAADQGKMAEAEKRYNVVIDSGDKQYAALAKLSLGEIYFATGRAAEGERLLRSLIDKPTVFVSKEEATLVLARAMGATKPEEARKLVDPLRSGRTAVSQNAIVLYGELTQK
jgi:predicted negative regulator of RcsB-dependent stress response